MNRYPFILSSFPEIQIGMKPEVSFRDLLDLLKLNLSRKDEAQVELLLRPIDLDNIRAFWSGYSLNEQGSLNAKELEEALLVQGSFPSFVFDFLDRYDTTEERLHNFSSLYASLYREMIPQLSGFLRSYYQMEREIRLVLTALRSKSTGRDLTRELQFEDLHDPLVLQILAQKDSTDYAPPQEYEDLKALFVENRSDPMKLSLALAQYRFDRILELEECYQSFSIDRILGFLARLIIVEKWAQLDREKGLGLIDDLSKNG